MNYGYWGVYKHKREQIAPFCNSGQLRLLAQFHDVRGLFAFRALCDFKFHTFPFIEGFVSTTVDGRKMDKDIFAIIVLDETITFFCIKPLHLEYVVPCCFSSCAKLNQTKKFWYSLSLLLHRRIDFTHALGEVNENTSYFRTTSIEGYYVLHQLFANPYLAYL